jgi:hypothetical protein
MTDSANVEIRLVLNDAASAGLSNAQQQAQKISTATEKASAKAAAAAARGAAIQRSAQQRMAQARETLGIRSEKTIQREIQRTEAAYNRLARSGAMSWREQARAAEQMKSRVTQLTNEMGKLTTKQKLMRAGKIAAVGVAGFTAAGVAVKGDVQKTLSADERISRLAMKAYEDRDAAGINAGQDELRDKILAISKASGGTKEQAMDAIDSMLADGMELNDALTALPKALRAGAGTGIDAQEFAKLGTSLSQNMGIAAEDLMKVYNMAAVGGMQGKYEIGDIVRGTPEQSAKAKAAGMTGLEGFADIIAANEAAARATGTPGEAGNAVSGLLSDLTSPRLANKIKQATGLDASKYFAKQREQGFSRISALTNFIDSTLAKDAAYSKYKKEYDAEGTSEERRATLQSLMTGRQGEVVGQFLGRDESRLAMLGILGNRAFYEETRQKAMGGAVDGSGVIDKQFEVASSQDWFKTRQGGESIDSAEQAFTRKFTGLIGMFSEGITKVCGGNEELAGALIVGGKAVLSFAATVAAAALIAGGGKIPGLGKAAAGIKGAAGAAASGVKGAAGAVSGGAGRILATRGAASLGASVASAGLGTAALGLTAAGAAGYGIGTLVNRGINAGISKVAGRDMSFGTWLYEKLNGDKEEEIAKMMAPPAKPPEPQPVEVDARLQVDLAPGLVLKNQTMEANVGKAHMAAGNIRTGAP